MEYLSNEEAIFVRRIFNSEIRSKTKGILRNLQKHKKKVAFVIYKHSTLTMTKYKTVKNIRSFGSSLFKRINHREYVDRVINQLRALDPDNNKYFISLIVEMQDNIQVYSQDFDKVEKPDRDVIDPARLLLPTDGFTEKEIISSFNSIYGGNEENVI